MHASRNKKNAPPFAKPAPKWAMLLAQQALWRALDGANAGNASVGDASAGVSEIAADGVSSMGHPGFCAYDELDAITNPKLATMLASMG